jgi:hypothetical protein
VPGCWARIVGSRAPEAILKTTIYYILDFFGFLALYTAAGNGKEFL